MGKHERGQAVPSVTSAREPLSDDIAHRNTRYMWQMSTRVVCFVGALVVDHWTRWILVAGAVVLPYVAVVLANAGRERPDTSGPEPVDAPAIGPGRATGSLAGGSGTTDDVPEEGAP